MESKVLIFSIPNLMQKPYVLEVTYVTSIKENYLTSTQEPRKTKLGSTVEPYGYYFTEG